MYHEINSNNKALFITLVYLIQKVSLPGHTPHTCTVWLMHVPAEQGGGPRVVVSTAAFHARVRGSVPGLGGL